ncbi:NrdR family transcriptional regulator [Bifidobacterium gallicum DSM 20093 = LMG 11596]|uniref:Transcriptional repressor NrdR n=3 Tax=Bifidobacterium gallicum TaxID=78342 RepID=A0A087AKC6_9BIFI|nr:NrdR family transcriptional regulator [Bifidobacterium gallicum DSM 20093 = LMG 11596]
MAGTTRPSSTRPPMRVHAMGTIGIILEGMHCPFCHSAETKVIDTRIGEDGYSIRRRRQCLHCQKRFTTMETTTLLVQKRSGDLEPFTRDKVVSGVRKACQGRPVKEEDLKRLGMQVEEDLRSQGLATVPSDVVGRAILKPLRALDKVGYIRFASIYQNYSDLDDFQHAIDELRHDDDLTQ